MLILMGNSGINPSSVVNPDDEDPRVRISCISEIEHAWLYQYQVQYFQSQYFQMLFSLSTSQRHYLVPTDWTESLPLKLMKFTSK